MHDHNESATNVHPRCLDMARTTLCARLMRVEQQQDHIVLLPRICGALCEMGDRNK